MKITRTMTIDTNEIQIGDRIEVGHYTATCQALPGEGLALFLLDQYLDQPYAMAPVYNGGGYMQSELRYQLNLHGHDQFPDEIYKMMQPVNDQGDLLRLPFYGEMFGHDDWYNSGAVEPDNCEQWPLMKERANRIAERKGESYEWGWLQNKYVRSAARFCGVVDGGDAGARGASNSLGVRPAFLIKLS